MYSYGMIMVVGCKSILIMIGGAIVLPISFCCYYREVANEEKAKKEKVRADSKFIETLLSNCSPYSPLVCGD
tara:strand:+ start:223 stop:438 length:216 start_codon:yes stop_codon:yes gene_type:complete